MPAHDRRTARCHSRPSGWRRAGGALGLLLGRRRSQVAGRPTASRRPRRCRTRRPTSASSLGSTNPSSSTFRPTHTTYSSPIPAVADAVTRTARRIYLFGKSVGETNIFVFGPNGEQIVSLDLAVERDVAGLEEYIKRFIPTSNVSVELINDNVVLTGTVETPLDAHRAASDRHHFRQGRRSDDRPVFADRCRRLDGRRRRHRQSGFAAPAQPA